MAEDTEIFEYGSLEAFVEGLPEEHLEDLRKFRFLGYNKIMDLLYKLIARKGRYSKISLTYLYAAMCLACVEAAMSIAIAMSRKNPVAGQLMKDNVKEKVAKW